MRVFAVVLLGALVALAAGQDFVNTKVKRTIHAAEHSVNVKTDFTVEAIKATNAFIFALPEAEAAHVAFLRAKSGSSTLAVKKLGALCVPIIM